MKKKFNMIEEEKVVIYDESDDYDPGEEQIVDDDDELDYDYIRKYEKLQEIEQTKEKRQQRWVTFGVITGIIVFIAGLSYFNFKVISF